MAHTSQARPSTRTSDPVLLALRVTAIATVVVLLWQFVTAGGLVSGSAAAVGPHGVGAIVLHVVTGLAVLAAAALWRRRGGAPGPTVLAAVLFVLSFAQAYAADVLVVHVPGAMILTVGAVVLAAWSLRSGAAS